MKHEFKHMNLIFTPDLSHGFYVSWTVKQIVGAKETVVDRFLTSLLTTKKQLIKLLYRHVF